VQTLPGYRNSTASTKGMQLAVVPPIPKEPVSKPSLWERLTSLAHRKPKETAVIVAMPGANQAKPAEPATSTQPKLQPTASTTTSTAPKVGTTATPWPPAYRGQPGAAAAATENSDQFRSTLLVRRPSPPPVAEVSLPPLTNQTPAPPALPAVSTSSPASPVVRVAGSSTQPSAPVVAAAASTVPVKSPSAPPPVVGSTALPGPMVPIVSPAHLRTIVQKGCGKLAREVRVEKGKEGQLMVHVVGNRESEQQLIATLLALPEIASTNVRLEIHVSH
jgi:hypothetical protein